jgi:hypothetical protein
VAAAIVASSSSKTLRTSAGKGGRTNVSLVFISLSGMTMALTVGRAKNGMSSKDNPFCRYGQKNTVFYI